jgi:hypothetical protein
MHSERDSPAKKGFAYVFTVMDTATRWQEPFPLHDITAPDCAEHRYLMTRLSLQVIYM